MKKELFQSDQPILADDLNLAQTTKEEAITERLTDVFSAGVLEDTQIYPSNTDETQVLNVVPGSNNIAGNPTITVRSGVAFSPTGERILILSLTDYENPVMTLSTVISGNSTLPDGTLNGPITKTDNGIGGFTLTPRSSGSVNIPLIQNQTNRVWLGYLQTTDPSVFSLSNTTNERLFTKATDGFEIKITTSSTNPDATRFILIAEVVVTNIVDEANISFVNRQISYTRLNRAGIVVNTSLKPATYTEGAANLTGTVSAADFIINTLTFIVSVNGTSDQTVTFAGTDPITISDVLSQINSGITGITASNSGNAVKLVAKTSIQIKNGTANTVLGFTNGQSAYTKITSLDNHINSLGSGFISPSNPHGLSASDLGIVNLQDVGGKLSSSGLIVPDATTNSSALCGNATSSGTPADNIVQFKGLLSTESLNIGGTLVTSADIGADVSFQFVDGVGAPIANGVYTFYVDKTLKTIVRSAANETIYDPENKFVLAKITWTSPSLVLPLVDYRFFGTTANRNMRFESLSAFTLGVAAGNRTESFYGARIVGTVSAGAFNITGTSLTVQVDNGSSQTVNFYGIDPVPIEDIVYQINAGITGIVATKTPDSKIKLIAYTSLKIMSGTACAVLGFTPLATDSGNMKEIKVSGEYSTIGGQDMFISLYYGEPNHPAGTTNTDLLTSVETYINGLTLRTDINYVNPLLATSAIINVAESIS